MKASIVNREILHLALPSIIANITVPLVGMVDIAVAGHLDASAATLIGGIAIGSVLFDLLYWNFGFLRVGTGGLTAQAFGRGEAKECSRILARALGIALACALLLLLVQWLFVRLAFLFIDCSPEVRTLASSYFHIRIWAAPATLSLMVLKGWFIGMQDSLSPMITDLVVNIVNILASIFLSLGLSAGNVEIIPALGFPGIALGTVLAQYSGLLAACLLLLKHRRSTFSGLSRSDFSDLYSGEQTRRFFVMNADLFVRSLCFIAIYIGFTVISARYGDTLLAVSSIMMKLLMIFSYFTDGFAYAAEAMTGRYIGSKDRDMTLRTIRWTFLWSMGIAVLFIGIYHLGGDPMLRVMTSDVSVISAARSYLPWLYLMPVVGCAAFTWDGIFIGATATRSMRNSMLWSVLAFAVVEAAGLLLLHILAQKEAIAPDRYDGLAVHVLMTAYFAHLLARTIHLTLRSRTLTAASKFI